MNTAFVAAQDPAQKDQLRRAITRLLPVLEDLKAGRLSADSAAVLSVPADAPSGNRQPASATGMPPLPPQNIPVAPTGTKATGRAANALIPLTFNDYIGQEKVKQSLAVSIAAAKKAGRPLAHMLICSSYGLGKTTLAHIIASQMNMPFFNVNATHLKDVRSISLYCAKIDRSCILFIDEIHALKKDVQTALLSIMTDFAVSYLDEDGKYVRSALPVFTLIGATTQAGELLKPFLNRFTVIELEDYTEEERCALVRAKITNLGYEITNGAVWDIARRCRGVPRTIETFVRGVTDLALVMDQKTVTEVITAEYFAIQEIDTLGLNKNDRNLLSILDSEARPLALTTLESKTGIHREDLEYRYEPYLLRLGLMEKTERGRVITAAGRAYLHPEKAADTDSNAITV